MDKIMRRRAVYRVRFGGIDGIGVTDGPDDLPTEPHIDLLTDGAWPRLGFDTSPALAPGTRLLEICPAPEQIHG